MLLFWREIKAAEIQKISEDDSVYNQNYQKWFGKFRARDILLKDYPVKKTS